MKTAVCTHMRIRAGGRRGEAAFTIAEAVIAVMISTLSLGAVMLLNAQQLKLIRSTRESNAASTVLQDRVEQLRTTSWKNMTNSSWLKTTVLPTVPKTLEVLGGTTETITISAWPPGKIAGRIVVRKSGDTYTTVDEVAGIADESQARVDLVLSWSGADNRRRERSYATVISNGGITRVGLSDHGGQTGTGSTPSTSPTGPTPDPTEPTDPSDPAPDPVPPTPSGDPPPADPTPNPGNQGQGNGGGNDGNDGRGNTHGKSGKDK